MQQFPGQALFDQEAYKQRNENGDGAGLGRRENAPHNSQQNNDGDQKPPEGSEPANKDLFYIESRLVDRVVAANSVEMGQDHHGQPQKHPRQGAAQEKTPD